MSKFNWRNGFAIGLVVGVCAALIFCAALHRIDAEHRNAAYNPDAPSDQRYETANSIPNVPQWRVWGTRVFKWEDTLAQWIMMAFTIVAAGLLLGTLRVTRRMASETTRIGEKQVRAYVSTCGVQTFDKKSNGEIDFFELTFKNFGQSPARIETILTTVAMINTSDFSQIWSQEYYSEQGSISAGAVHKETLRLGKSRIFNFNYAGKVRDRIVTVYGVIHYKDVFGKPDKSRFSFVVDEDEDVPEHLKREACGND